MRLLRRAMLYARTARNLRWQQWIYRPVRRAQQWLPVGPKGPLRFDVEPTGPLSRAVVAWGPGDAATRVELANEILSGTFRFLNCSRTLPAVDWQQRYVSHLWNYNLHYFDYALDLAWAYRLTSDIRYLQRFQELVESWIGGNPPGKGDGWQPYPVSLRVVNWVYALLLLDGDLDVGFRTRLLSSLYLQTRYLAARLEFHILANHLLKNVKALAVAGLFFRGAEAMGWRERGTRLMWDEIREQVLPDGGHYERSPMYHAIALADLLEVVALRQAGDLPIPEEVLRRAKSMTGALGLLSRPDGSLHLFNDTANGIAPERCWLDGLARQTLGVTIPDVEGMIALPESGYFGFVAPERGVRLLIDCGEPGPTYQPGHAHCDLLSFELDVDGIPFVVDAGVHGYDADPYREYVRSTRAHNTVMIGGQEQSELWGTFRVARRAQVVSCRQSAEGAGYRFEGACRPFHCHDAVHSRVIAYHGALTVTDRVSGADALPLQGFLHLHPSWRVTRSADGFSAAADGRVVTIRPFGADRVQLRTGERDPVQGWYCPEFGMALAAPVLEMHCGPGRGREFGYHIEIEHA